MKKIIVIIAAVLFIIGLSCVPLYARGGHGGGHGGHGGFHGGHGSSYKGHGSGHGYYHGGTGYVAFGSYAAFSSYGWYGGGLYGGANPGYGGDYPDSWYYYDSTYDDPYLLQPDPFYTDTTQVEGSVSDLATGPGEWVEVPGQWADGMWVPPHNAWVPDNKQ